jgi:hypothetical protein
VSEKPNHKARAAAIAEVLVGIALRTDIGQQCWNSYLIGEGLPKGQGSLTVEKAAYAPKQEDGSP